MKNYKEVSKAREILEKNGYQVYNLWHIDDVKCKFECTDDQAHDVLIGALQSDATMTQIWEAIDCHAEVVGLVEKEN